MILVNMATTCLSGPGQVYDAIGTLNLDQEAKLVGRRADGEYWLIQNPASPTTLCWLKDASVTLTGDLRFYRSSPRHPPPHRSAAVSPRSVAAVPRRETAAPRRLAADRLRSAALPLSPQPDPRSKKFPLFLYEQRGGREAAPIFSLTLFPFPRKIENRT